VGGSQRPPTLDEVLQVLRPRTNAVVNLVGLPIADRPSFLLALWPRLQETWARVGRPHWLVLDEAHHLLPASWQPGTLALPQALAGLMMITVHPGMIAPAALGAVNTVVAVGGEPASVFEEFCTAVGETPPRVPEAPLAPGDVYFWERTSRTAPIRMQIVPGHTERRRHTRKYAEGELPPERSFYFRGAEGKLNLRAQNLVLFLQMAEGVDDDTWLHHLHAGDYARWFREGIKDPALAEEAEQLATRSRAEDGLSPEESRKLIRAAVERLYTQPASTPLPVPGTDAAALRK
jgi:hypothetical protein